MSAIQIAGQATGLSWASLLRGAAVAQCVGLAVAAVVLADAEAAVIAAATLVALGVLRFRERLGTVFLILMFADVAFFTAAAALTNLIELATPLATIGPGALAAIALPGLVASIASLARGDRARVRVRARSPSSRSPRWQPSPSVPSSRGAGPAPPLRVSFGSRRRT